MRLITSLLFFFVVVLCGCRSPKVITETITKTDTLHVTHDSVIIRERLVPIEVEIPQSSQSVIVPIGHDTTSVLQDKLYISVAQVMDGNLRHTLESKAGAVLPSKAAVHDTIMVYRDSLQTKSDNMSTKTIEVNKLTKWQKSVQVMGYLFLIGLVLIIIYVVKKFLPIK